MSTKHAITAGEARFFAYLIGQERAWSRARVIQEACAISDGSLHSYIRRFRELGLCEVAQMKPERYRFSTPSSPEGQDYLKLLKTAAEVIAYEESQS